MLPITFIATSDPEASKIFYQQVLGLPLQEDHPYALVFDNYGIPLRVQKVDRVAPPPYTTLGWVVDDIQQSVRKFADQGIEFERYPHLPQNSLGIWYSPDNAAVAWFRDPDGNLLSITQQIRISN